MDTWFTADLHLGHARIIELCGRPFSSVEEMNESLVARWNAVVSPADTVWVLGDFAMGRIAETLPLAKRLYGSKILVVGNHDRMFADTPAQKARWHKEYLAAGFDAIVHGSAVTRCAGVPVVVSHFPYEGDSHDADRFEDARPVDAGMTLIHGHVHEKWKENGRQVNAGVDVWDFAPVNEWTIWETVNGLTPNWG